MGAPTKGASSPGWGNRAAADSSQRCQASKAGPEWHDLVLQGISPGKLCPSWCRLPLNPASLASPDKSARPRKRRSCPAKGRNERDACFLFLCPDLLLEGIKCWPGDPRPFAVSFSSMHHPARIGKLFRSASQLELGDHLVLSPSTECNFQRALKNIFKMRSLFYLTFRRGVRTPKKGRAPPPAWRSRLPS